MRKLSDTISRLAALRARPDLYGQKIGPDRLENLSDFGSNPGNLLARIYLPDNLPSGAPLVVVLHGCSQTAAAYDHGSGWSQLADQEGFALLFPEQQRSNNANLCFNWFVPGDITRNSGEALSIRQMVEALTVVHGLDRSRVFVTGLSAGGAMACVMLATYPEVFAGGAIVAGLPYGSASTIPEAFDRMRGHGGPSKRELQQSVRAASPHQGPWPTVSVWQGSADHTVVPSNADAVVAQWLAVHGLENAPTRSRTIDGQVRQAWRDADGREAVEKYSIAGMGHGTPLRTAGENGLGAAGPYMLEAGISSTRHIAGFWGILKAGAGRTVEPRAANAGTFASAGSRAILPADAQTFAKPRVVRTEPKPAGSPDSRPARGIGIQKVIEDALRAAGLMR